MRPLVIFFLAVSSIAQSQEIPSVGYAKGAVLLGPYATTVNINNFSSKFGLGVSAEYFFGRNFAFGSSIGAGPDYGEFSATLLGALGVLAFKSESTGVSDLLLFLPFLFENPIYHFQLGGVNDLSVSMNLMKFRYIYEKNSFYDQYWFASGSLGLRYSMISQSKWQWSLFAEGTVMYYVHNPTGFQVGVAVRHLGGRTD